MNFAPPAGLCLVTERVVLTVGGRVGRADIPYLCGRLRDVLPSTDADVVVCDVRCLEDPDAATVDALAHLQLTARRLGHRLQLRHACATLRELLDLMGLSGALPLYEALLVEPTGEAEERKEPRGVEEKADPGDPTL